MMMGISMLPEVGTDKGCQGEFFKDNKLKTFSHFYEIILGKKTDGL